MMPGDTSGLVRHRTTHCVHGHPYTEENSLYRWKTLRKPGGGTWGPYMTRECRTCRAIKETVRLFTGKRGGRGGRVRHEKLTLEQRIASVEASRRSRRRG